MEQRKSLRTAGVLLGAALALLTQVSIAHAQIPMPRVGVSLTGGGFAGTVDGGYGGLQARLGVQWNPAFATYVQSQGLLGVMTPQGGSGVSVGGLLNTLMFEGTFASVIELGGGPGIDFFWGCDVPQGGPTCSRSGPFLSLDARAALRLAALSISIDVHPMWLAANAMATWVTLGVGLDF